MRSMLLILDGSRQGQGSIQLAVRWARRFGARVSALGWVDEHALAAPEPAPIGGDAFKDRRDRSLLEQAHRRVDEALTRFSREAESAGIAFSAGTQVGERTAGLSAAAQPHDVVIISRDTHFTGPDEYETDGTWALLSGHCARPLVVVPPEIQAGAGNLIAYSGGMRAAHALQTLVANDLHQGVPNHVLSIHGSSMDIATDRARRGLEFLEAHGGQAFLLPVVTHEAVADVLIEHARRLGVELVVMGSHPRSWLTSYLIGSIPHEVLSQSGCPVFVTV